MEPTKFIVEGITAIIAGMAIDVINHELEIRILFISDGVTVGGRTLTIGREAQPETDTRLAIPTYDDFFSSDEGAAQLLTQLAAKMVETVDHFDKTMRPALPEEQTEE